MAPAALRKSWVIDRLDACRYPYAEQLPQEWQTKQVKMADSPFAFFRGSAPLFYEDMLAIPASAFENAATGRTWLNGDLHLGNLGAFRDGSGSYIFDANDFDEGYLGSYLWDLRRMAASIVLAARENGLDADCQRQLVIDFGHAYLAKIGDFRGNADETDYRLNADNTDGVIRNLIRKSATQTHADLLTKYTRTAGGKRQFLTNDELCPVDAATADDIRAGINEYITSIAAGKRQAADFYAVTDIRLRLGSGIGSLGRYRYYVLIAGGNEGPIILQLKQETPSAVAVAAPGRLPTAAYGLHEGRRVARSMKAALAHTDPLLGWTSIAGRPFVVREKSPYEAKLDFARLNNYDAFADVVRCAGKIAAKNHAASDRDYDISIVPNSIDRQIDEIVGDDKLTFQKELAQFALSHADQVELDYRSFVTA